jgi:hypothetical protein
MNHFCGKYVCGGNGKGRREVEREGRTRVGGRRVKIEIFKCTHTLEANCQGGLGIKTCKCRQPAPPPHFTSLHFTSLHFTSLHFTSLHFTSLHFTSLHFTSLHLEANCPWLEVVLYQPTKLYIARGRSVFGRNDGEGGEREEEN